MAQMELTIYYSILVELYIKRVLGQYIYGVETKCLLCTIFYDFMSQLIFLKGRFFLFSRKLARF